MHISQTSENGFRDFAGYNCNAWDFIGCKGREGGQRKEKTIRRFSVTLTAVLLPFDGYTTALYDHSTTYVTTAHLPVCVWSAALHEA